MVVRLIYTHSVMSMIPCEFEDSVWVVHLFPVHVHTLIVFLIMGPMSHPIGGGVNTACGEYPLQRSMPIKAEYWSARKKET